MARDDREAALESWLEARNIPEGWALTSALVELDYTVDSLSGLAERFKPAHLGAAIAWFCHAYSVYRLMDEIRHGAGRVSEIVGALKSYTYVGQAPIQAVNVNEGLRNTLIILRSKLKEGVTVERQLAEDLPAIQAYGSELNQVWTNLIDNAVGALGGRGRIRLRSYAADASVVVEIEDDGPGIPEAIQARVFDPFFTTKAPGEGTGLGLHTSYSIVVKRHGGTIDVSSRPGCTTFTVRLPAELPRRAPDAAGAGPAGA